jgi:putative transposase
MGTYRRSHRKAKLTTEKKGAIREATNGMQHLCPEPLLELLRQSVRNLALEAGIRVAKRVIDDEVNRLCGERYSHGGEQFYRHGTQQGVIVVGGQKVRIEKPRVRSTSNEVALESYELLQNKEVLSETMLSRMVSGVSTRSYEATVESTPGRCGVSKSAVSRSFVKASKLVLEELLTRRLDEHRYPAILIDGISYQGEQILVALGIREDGTKKILGIEQGTTENTEVVRSLLANLIERGLRVVPTLFVIDGAKGIRSAIASVFGRKGVIQRCQIHKARNVVQHLAEKHQREIAQRLSRAYKSDTIAQAEKSLSTTLRYLEKLNPSAARSLKEGMSETLTVLRLGLTGDLRRILSSTNTIESAHSTARTLTNRTKRFRDGDMRLRWCAQGLIGAEKRFRRVKGFNNMKDLCVALDEMCRDTQVDLKKEAA